MEPRRASRSTLSLSCECGSPTAPAPKPLSPWQMPYVRSEGAMSPKTVKGKPCRTCAGTERYANGGKCVACKRTREQRRYVPTPKVETPERALSANGKRFLGSPCARGHDG